MNLRENLSKLNPGARGVALAFGAYVITMMATVFVIIMGILIMMHESNCSTMTNAMLVLWFIIAGIFLISGLVLRSVAKKLVEDSSVRTPVLIVYGVGLVISFLFIAFVLLVLFNC